MAYEIDWNIIFTTDGKRRRLALLAECEVYKSVDNLADTATIVLPELVVNEPLDFKGKIDRGTEVQIQFGYDGNLQDEFNGFVREVTVNDSSLKILCEDALFLFRVGVPDAELKASSLKKISEYLVQNIDSKFKVVCDYEITYEKFTIHAATGYDVLKKMQEQTKANIYFDTANSLLHIHAPYIEVGKKVYYSMQKNIETSSLEFKNKIDTKTEVTVESTDLNGNVLKKTVGTTGGDKVTIKVGNMDAESLERVATAELAKRAAPKYEGTFDTWLEPHVAPGDSARLKDEDYPDQAAFYFVQTVVSSISEGGGKRTVTPAIKLS